MTEIFILALVFSMVQLHFKLGKLEIHKDSYQIKPILKRWSIYPVIFMSVFYIFLQFTIIQQNYYFVQYQDIIKKAILLSYIILGMDVLFRNGKHKEWTASLACLFGGFGLNSLVMHFNNGKMPIYPNISWSTGYTQYDMIINATKYGDFHVLGDHTTKLIFACDIFDFGTSILSIGDILCRLFAFIVVYYSVKQLNHYKDK